MTEIETPRPTSVVLLDIEGTTTSISFVKDVLFPYARENVSAHLDSFWGSASLEKDIEGLRHQNACDLSGGDVSVPRLIEEEGQERFKQSLVEYVSWQIDNDKKTTALKEMQGRIWKSGYASGVLKSHVYEDVPTALRKWHEEDIALYVYSSGSVDAQKLLFAHTTFGDLTHLFSGNFDTKIGAKVEADSYRNIITEIGVPANEILFLTDVAKEARAAAEANITSVLVVREGNAPLEKEDSERFATITSFAQLNLSEK